MYDMEKHTVQYAASRFSFHVVFRLPPSRLSRSCQFSELRGACAYISLNNYNLMLYLVNGKHVWKTFWYWCTIYRFTYLRTKANTLHVPSSFYPAAYSMLNVSKGPSLCLQIGAASNVGKYTDELLLRRPHPAFWTDPRKQIPSNFPAASFFFKSEIAFQFTCRSRQPFTRRTCCSSLDLAFWSDGLLTKDGKEEAEEEGEAREKILIECSPPDNEFFPTIQMYLQNAWVIHYSRFSSVTMDLRNEWWYLFADFISLILLIPWPVYLY